MAKRMKLVTEAEYESLSKRANLPENTLVNLEKSATQTLNDKHIPEDVKIRIYSSVMSSVGNQLKQILNKPLPVAVVNLPRSDHDSTWLPEASNLNTDTSAISSNALLEETDLELNDEDLQLLQKLPEKWQKKARNIMLILKEHSGLITWNKKGEINFLNSGVNPGTSIVDLLSYTLHDLKWDTAPKGTNRFLQCLKRVNLPLSLTRKGVRKILANDIDEIPQIRSAGDSRHLLHKIKRKLKNWKSESELEFENSEDEFQPANASTPTRNS